jgi:protein TonB
VRASSPSQANPSPSNLEPAGAALALMNNRQIIPNSAKGSPSLEASASSQPIAPEPKKSSLGEVRLATPKVTRRQKTLDNGEAEAGLIIGGEQPESGKGALGAGLGANSSQPAAPSAPIAVGGDVKPAKLVASVPPLYPVIAKNQHVSGDVRIDAVIDPNGRVTTMKVVSGPTLLHQAAMDALRQWKYQPASLNGSAVQMHLTVTIQFRLR